MKTASILVIAALFYGATAINGPIKNKLGEVARKNLAEVDQATDCVLGDLPPVDLDFCDCDIGTGVLPPPGGAIDVSVFNAAILASQGQVVT